MHRGTIVTADLPRPQGKPGHEQHGPRPVVVVQESANAKGLSTVVVVPLTSRGSAAAFARAFTVSPSSANGLTATSVVLTHQIRAVDQSRLGLPFGALESCHLEQLERELRLLLKL